MAKEKSPPPAPLTCWPVGSWGTVVNLAAEGDAQLTKLLALGIIPGTEIHILRRSPCWVIQIGFTQLALDDSLARTILLLPAHPPGA
ncbi:MAG: FeoA family protein [Limnochordia bacterium]|jgi:Fe2+ transport system protein FeoA